MAKFTEEQAESLLRDLTDYYGEPVLRMSSYCDAVRTWAKCMLQRSRDPKSDYMDRDGSSWTNYIGQIELQISKSNLLARLLYGGEKLRTKRCPIHDGVWSGIGECEHGCQLTGWIPEG
jgi:hypothetical protein